MSPNEVALRDRNGMAILDREECFGLLATVPVGRVSVTFGALPVILPVNFAVTEGGEIVFRPGDGQRLRAALDDAVIAFEADAFDTVTRTGWSVLVQGRARVLTPDESDDYLGLALDAWAGIDEKELVVLRTELISGRRLGAALR